MDRMIWNLQYYKLFQNEIFNNKDSDRRILDFDNRIQQE